MTDADGADWPPIRPAVAGGEPPIAPPAAELDPEYRAAWEAWSTAALSGAPHQEVHRLWRVVNDVLARAESPVVMESSSCECCGAMFDRQAGPDPDRWCKHCSKSRRAVAGGEPTPYRQGVDRHPMFRDNEHVTATDSRCAIEHVPGRICMCDRDHDATEAAGGEPTRPSEQEWLQALLAAYDDWYRGRDWQGRFAPLIERTEAAARREVVAAVEAVPYPTGFVTAGGAVEQFRADILRAARSATGETT